MARSIVVRDSYRMVLLAAFFTRSPTHAQLTVPTPGIFGASRRRPCVQAGLLDEIVLHLAPMLLGAGVRRDWRGGQWAMDLECVSPLEAEQPDRSPVFVS